jgi:MoaA/NifB/PqqE/SkfB family radical SAM enzyme
MDLELFRRMTREMAEAGVQEIGLFYLGESFSNPELLVEACRWCKRDLGMPYVFLTTNGTLAEPRVVEQLMVEGLDSLKWSVNAADEAQYEQIMGVSGKLFWRSLDNLRHAYSVRTLGQYPTRLYASSIRYDGEQAARMDEMLDRFVRPYVDEHDYLPLYGMALTVDRMREDTGWTPSLGNMGRYDEALGTGNRADQPVCWAAFTEGHVRADGHLSACCFGATDRFDVGNLREQSFMAAWNSPEYQAIRKAQLDYAAGDRDALKGTMCEVCIAYEA